MKKLAIALLVGALLGFTGTILHNAITPVGLVLALLVSWLGIWLVGSAYRSRAAKLFSVLGWALVVFRAGTQGTSYEILIFGNTFGNIFLLAGFFGVLIVAVLPTS